MGLKFWYSWNVSWLNWRGNNDATRGHDKSRSTKIPKTSEERNQLYAFAGYCELWGEGLGMRKFALTRSRSSSRVECSLGKRPLWGIIVSFLYATWNGEKHVQREAIFSAHRPSSLLDLIFGTSQLHIENSEWIMSLLPVGSGSSGNISLPHIAQTAAAEIIPANPEDGLSWYPFVVIALLLFSFGRGLHTEK